MTEPVTREDVIRKIDLANDSIDESYSREATPERRQLEATNGLTQATLAVAYATLMVAENQPLGVLGDVVGQLRAIREEITSMAGR